MIRVLALLIWLLGLNAPLRAEPITVFAAASLQGALTEIAAGYDGAVTLSFAGSGTLARQIAAGAPVDAVVLAHAEWMNWLENTGRTLDDTRRDAAGGALVLVGQADAAPLTAVTADSLRAALATGTGTGRLAIGQRDGVPAGSYAREWLRSIDAWDTIEPHLAETDNVRAALALVAQGAAPLAVVYASDAQADPRVKILYRIPASAHAAIRYPAAALTPAGAPFVAYLTTPEAVSVFARHGFAP